MSANEPKIEIEIRGGMIAAVRTRDTIGAIPYQLVDYDTEGVDDADIGVDGDGGRYMKDGDRTSVEAFVTDDTT